jgi:hypothetical protein
MGCKRSAHEAFGVQFPALLTVVNNLIVRVAGISVFVLSHLIALYFFGGQFWSGSRWFGTLGQVAVLSYLWARTGGHSSGLAIFGVYDPEDDRGKLWGDVLAVLGFVCALVFQFS